MMLICGDTQIPASDIQRALHLLKKADKTFDGPEMTGFHKLIFVYHRALSATIMVKYKLLC